MRLDGSGCHLTYCTNIHPGETWAEVRANLERFVPSVRDQVARGEKFGIGLRLSQAAAHGLSKPEALAEFKRFLADHGLYVFTLNGFPYGKFHDTPVKHTAYLPDWQDEARLSYTNQLADLMAELLPDEPGLEGSVSTVPGAFKPDVRSRSVVARMTDLMVRHVAHLAALRARTGKTVGLALEPEPCCFLETVEETVAFFQERLFAEQAVQRLMEFSGLDRQGARAALRTHLGVCLDLCHAAVEFEDPGACVRQLDAAGIRVLKVQITAGLRLPQVNPGSADLLRPFDDQVYLHQVVERGEQGLVRYLDLPDALRTLEGNKLEREWRVHCHVPVFLDDLGAFASTQDFVREALALHRARPLSAHLEVETYTWGVLPERYRGETVDRAISRELQWVQAQLQA